MINGLTILPHVFGSMNRVAPFVEKLGFPRPKVASHYWRWSFQSDIRQIHQADPDARFVLVGYSIGASVACSMAETLGRDGIFIDLLVYIDAHSFIHDFTKRPPNVGRIVSINSSAPFFSGKCRAGEECYQVDTMLHLATPRQETTLHILAHELTELAACPHNQNVRPICNLLPLPF
jgi:pimeloyl-ACP methyl ester carboxylesterase